MTPRESTGKASPSAGDYIHKWEVFHGKMDAESAEYLAGLFMAAEAEAFERGQESFQDTYFGMKLNEAYAKGFSEAKEQAAKAMEEKKYTDLNGNEHLVGPRIAAEIRSLTPKVPA